MRADATKDKSQWERALTNVSAMYFAGSETTANGTAFTLAALAIDRDSLSQLEQVSELTFRLATAIPCVQFPPGVTALTVLSEPMLWSA